MSWLKNLLKKIFGKEDEPKELPKVEVPKEEPKIETPKEEPKIEPLPTKKEIDEINDGSAKSPDWNFVWDHCQIDQTDSAKKMLDWAITIIMKNKDKYIEVEKATKAPWWFVAGLHYREASLRFDGCLHNGDPWNKVTTHVPRGLGPWSSWAEAAIHAIRYDKLIFDSWTIAECLYRAEKFNGFGYRKKIGDNGVIEYSPYVTAYTNWSDEDSKYKGDGVYDPNARESQLGVMAIWKEMENRGLINV